MNKISLVLLGLIASTAFAVGDDCTAGNILATNFDFPLLDTSIDGTDFEFCKSFQDGTYASCCSAETVNSIGDLIKAQVDKLATAVGDRDKNVLKLRNQALANNDALGNLKAAAKNAAGAAGGALDGFDTALDEVEEQFTDFTDNIQETITDFPDFQKLRGDCIKYLMKVQAAAMCLACQPPDVTADAIADSELDITDDGKSGIVDACFPYFEASENQNAAVGLYYSAKKFQGLADGLNKLAGGDATGLTDFMNNMGEDGGDGFGAPSADDVDQLPVQIPDGCTKDGCPWIFEDLLINGKVNWRVLARGGKIHGTFTGEEEEEEESSSRRRLDGRRLQTGWTPSQTEGGITVDWEDNPGDVDASDTSASAFRTGVIASVLALFALLF